MNHNSQAFVQIPVAPSQAGAEANDKFQFELHWYLVAVREDRAVGKPGLNPVLGLGMGAGGNLDGIKSKRKGNPWNFRDFTLQLSR